MGFSSNAGVPVAGPHHFDSLSRKTSKARPVAHCEAVPETAGSDGSSVQCYSLRPVVHETITVVAQNQGVLPEGKPPPHDQSYAALPTCSGHVEGSLFSVPGTCAGSSLSSCNANDRCFPHRLGGDHEWSPSPGSVAGPSSIMAYKLSRDVGSVSGSETLPTRPERSSCSCLVRQHIGGLLHKPSGGSALSPVIQSGSPDPSMVPGEAPLFEGDLSPGVFKSGSGHPVEAGAEARGMETPPRGGGAPSDAVRSCRGRPICVQGDITLSTVVLSQSSSPAGLDAMVQPWPRSRLYAFPPIALLPGVLERVRRDGVSLLLVAPYWPARVWFADLISLLDGSPLEIPIRRDLLSQASGLIHHPRPELWKLWAWPLRGPSS